MTRSGTAGAKPQRIPPVAGVVAAAPGGGRADRRGRCQPVLHSDAPTSAERPSARFTAGKVRPSRSRAGVLVRRSPGTGPHVLDRAARRGPARPDRRRHQVPAAQLRAALERLITARHCSGDDPDIRIVTDAGYDITRLAVMLYIGLDEASDVADSAGEQRALAGSSELVRA